MSTDFYFSLPKIGPITLYKSLNYKPLSCDIRFFPPARAVPAAP
jgi:hypothetical protein